MGRVTPDHLTKVAFELLQTTGVGPEEALGVAENLVAAELRGLPTHGVNLLPEIFDRIAAGQMELPTKLKVVADVGCAAGSFLDHIGGLAAESLAIEPCHEYHPSLKQRGYKVFESIQTAVDAYPGRIDALFSLSTLEHVLNPLAFFKQIRALLAGDGVFMVSTPNRADVLMEMLGADYHRFFYRTVHRWYFDMASLESLARRSGLEVVKKRCLQRFGISNTLRWLRDRRPGGDDTLPQFEDALINDTWKAYLESKGVGDYLYMLLKKI